MNNTSAWTSTAYHYCTDKIYTAIHLEPHIWYRRLHPYNRNPTSNDFVWVSQDNLEISCIIRIPKDPVI